MKTLKIIVLSLLVGMAMIACAPGSTEYQAKYDNAASYIMGGATIEKPVVGLEVNWVVGDVVLETYDGKYVVVEETCDSKLDPNTSLYYCVDNEGTLKIQFAKNGYKLKGDFKKKLHVKVPVGLVFREMELNCANGDIVINGVGCHDFEANVVESKIKTVGMRTSDFELNGVNINLTATFGAMPAEMEVNSTSCEATFWVMPEAGISCKMNGAKCEFESDLPVVRNDDGCYVINDGKCDLEFNVVKGKARVKSSFEMPKQNGMYEEMEEVEVEI